MTQHVPSRLVMITATESAEWLRKVGDLSREFDPAKWLEENGADLTIVATEAVRKVVYDALELGLG